MRTVELKFWGYTLGFLLVSFCLVYLGHIGKHIYLFSSFYVLAFLLLFGLVRRFPGDWPMKKQWMFIFGMAFIVRLAFLYFPASYDVSRYIWEGHLLNKGINPFIFAPDDPILQPFIPELQEIWQTVNHKDASGCYPPLSMLLFRLGAYISPTWFFFNVLIVLFDLAAVGVLILLVRAYKLPASRVLLYALNPLVLVFIAGESHLDPIQTLFICLCFYFLTQKKEQWKFFTLGCAIVSKYFAVIFTPFLITAKNWKKVFYLLVVVVIFYLPFWGTGTRLFTSLMPFGTVMHYNDSLTVLLRDLFGSNATTISLVLLLICFAVIFLTVHDPLKSSYLAVGCLLLFMATLHPWYLTLITPFLVFFPSRAWMYLHIAVVFTFPVLHIEYYTGVFQEIHWLKLFEYIPFYGLLIWDSFRNMPYFGARRFEPVRSISVIIPTLNESERIGCCLESVCKDEAVTEIIVVDGGSTDDTCEIARSMGAQVFTATKGRGNQINTGILHSHGDVILILHADCLIQEEFPTRILQKLQKHPQYIGGSVGMKFLHQSGKNRFIAWLNNARARWTGISFGDQAQFFRREALSLIGGFPDLMLMEDVELSMRLKEHGPLCFIPKGVIVSTRRWQKMGFWLNFRRVIWFCFSYLIQRRLGIGDTKRRAFYERYYSLDHV
jgi:rSAM/selenodomain-associated transferase 2